MKQAARGGKRRREARKASPALEGAISRLDRVHIVAVALALGLTAYLALEPTQNWILLLLSVLAALGTDNIVRTHPKAHFQRLDDTALFLFVPALATLSLGLFLEEVVNADWTPAAGLLSAVPFWLILRAEHDSVDLAAPDYASTRLVLNGATYIIAVLFFFTIYEFDLSLLAASFSAGVVSLLLAIEVLREEAMDTSRTIFYATAIGVLLAEAAWATHFLPLQGGAAAVFLLVALYLMTGMMHNYLADRLNIRTAGEFTAVAVAGLLLATLSDAYL